MKRKNFGLRDVIARECGKARRWRREARSRRIYFEGFMMGLTVLGNVVSKRGIVEEIDPFGHLKQ